MYIIELSNLFLILSFTSWTTGEEENPYAHVKSPKLLDKTFNASEMHTLKYKRNADIILLNMKSWVSGAESEKTSLGAKIKLCAMAQQYELSDAFKAYMEGLFYTHDKASAKFLMKDYVMREKRRTEKCLMGAFKSYMTSINSFKEEYYGRADNILQLV